MVWRHRFRRSLPWAACALVGVLLSTRLAHAQVGSATWTGVVRDQAGMVTAGATLTVVDTRTNAVRAVESNGEGVYVAAGLAPGTYRVEVALTGFGTARRDIRLATGETARVDFVLQVGTVAEQVTVVAAQPAVRLESAGLGTVVDADQVVRLPLNGRTFITLASLAPGVALPPASQLPRINGGRPRTNEYLFDGISVLQPEPGQVAYFPVIDTIQEFKVESNSRPSSGDSTAAS